jgi:hypothetical protein
VNSDCSFGWCFQSAASSFHVFPSAGWWSKPRNVFGYLEFGLFGTSIFCMAKFHSHYLCISCISMSPAICTYIICTYTSIYIEPEIEELGAHEKWAANLPVHCNSVGAGEQFSECDGFPVQFHLLEFWSVGTFSPFEKCLEDFATSETPVVYRCFRHGMTWYIKHLWRLGLIYMDHLATSVHWPRNTEWSCCSTSCSYVTTSSFYLPFQVAYFFMDVVVEHKQSKW